MLQLLDHTSLMRNYWVVTLALDFMVLMLVTLLSKFGLAIPELMENATLSAGQAVRNSLKATEHREVFIMLFLLKSAILGYFVYWGMHPHTGSALGTWLLKRCTLSLRDLVHQYLNCRNH